MKKLLSALLLAAFMTVAISTLSYAQDTSDKQVGIGFMVGEPTGLSFKSFNSGGDAFDVGLAWSVGRYDAINIHADYLWHNYTVFEDVDEGTMPFYIGLGGRIILDEDDDSTRFGARVPVGIDYLFEDAPVGIFLEVAPVFNVAPDTDFDVDGGIGVRFYL